MRLSIKGRPEAWQKVKIPMPEGSDEEIRVKYHLLTEPELRALRREELKRIKDAHGSQTDEDQANSMLARIDMMIELMTDDEADRRRNLVVERVLDWDIIDADAPGEGVKLECNDAAKRAVVDLARLFGPLYKGLLDASGEGQAKNS